MQYKNFTLDKFQEDAIKILERGNSVVVSAATGTGKTLIADYMINKAIEEGVKAVYTAPIKALSNQKYREFSSAYPGKVGMMTGDVVINPDAQILIMTTEVYRNILLERGEKAAEIKYVVFDEVHFINDIERGTVWEESIIFSPPEVRFVCLSATIPNYDQFAEWISTIKGHIVETVSYMKRAVPLSHQFYDASLGITEMDKIIQDTRDMKGSQQMQHDPRRGRKGRHGHGKKQRKVSFQQPNHIELIRQLEREEKLPAIFFSFSRALCEKRAKELSKKISFTNESQRKTIIDMYNKHVTEPTRSMHSAREIKQILLKGIGVHHAGMLPKLKEIVEQLFDKGLLKTLYATETFAVGINMPAKAVCFSSLEKYDGIGFRLLNTKEYFQLAGRAGRRGLDKVGYAISLVDRNHPENFEKMAELVKDDVEPIKSQYNLSYNTVLNLQKNYTPEQIETILKSNFGYFMKRKSQTQVRIMQSYNNYLKTLERLGFLEDKNITWKGEFATRIYTKELEVGELVYSGILNSMTEQQIAITIASLIYEPRRMDSFDTTNVDITPIMKKIDEDKFLSRKIKKMHLKNMYRVMQKWLSGCEFEELLDICNLAEGDVIRLFRQQLDMLKQIKGSLVALDEQDELVNKINNIMDKIDRDLIAIEL